MSDAVSDESARAEKTGEWLVTRMRKIEPWLRLSLLFRDMRETHDDLRRHMGKLVVALIGPPHLLGLMYADSPEPKPHSVDEVLERIARAYGLNEQEAVSLAADYTEYSNLPWPNYPLDWAGPIHEAKLITADDADKVKAQPFWIEFVELSNDRLSGVT